MSLAMTIAGLVLIGAGFDLSHRLSGRVADAVSLLAPVGVLMAAAGAISLAVPGFFH